MSITNRGKYRILGGSFRAAALPSSFYVALVTAASAPTVDTKIMSELTEIVAGNGYTSGGIQVTPDAVGFPTFSEDDTNNLAKVGIKDLTLTAVGGPIPSAGSDIAWAVLTDDNATLANREVWAFKEVTVGSLSVGEVITLEDWLLQLLEEVGDMTDPNAIHDNVAAEISAITAKGSPVSADLLLIEDSAASNVKRRITVGSLPGESNTASNIGTGGVGVFDGKVGVDLQFKKVNAGSAKITVTDDVPNNEVDVDLGAVDLADLNNVSAATTTANQVLATPNGAPGDYSGRALVAADIPNVPGKDTDAIHDNVAAEISALTEKVTPVSADLILIEDSAAANAKKKVQVGNLPTGGGGGAAEVQRTFNARLTTETGVPISTSDRTAQTTIYLTPYKGNTIALYNGASWDYFNLSADISVSVPATTNTNYDVFVYDSTGLTLEAVAWTNDTTRATALVLQDGVYVKSGATGRRYVGTFRTTGVSGQTEDRLTSRLVWNYYNRVRRQMLVTESTASWSYASGAWRSANNSTANRVKFVVGIQEDIITAQVFCGIHGNSDVSPQVGIDLDSVSSTVANIRMGDQTYVYPKWHAATWKGYTGIGYHFLQWTEFGANTGSFHSTDHSRVAGMEAEIWA